MPMDPLVAVAGFVAVAAITPGPNNFIVMTAAGRGGFPAALPAMAGVVAGGLGLLVVIWSGAGAAFAAVPQLRLVLVAAGALYLAWLGAVLIWRARGSGTGLDQPAGHRRAGGGGLPSTMLGVAAFQFMNPKGWVLVATAAAALSAGGTGLAALATLAALLIAIPSVCLILWAGAGAAIAGWLGRPAARRRFDRAMGALLIASAALLLLA